MFSMVNGRWPRITADGVALADLEADVEAGTRSPDELGAAIDALVAHVVRVQADAGLDLVTDGSVRWAHPDNVLLRALADDDVGPDGLLVRTWRGTAAVADRTVAQAITGPYTLAHRIKGDEGASLRTEFTLEFAAHIAAEIRALADAGCPMVMVEEPDALKIGHYPAEHTSEVERELFAATMERLLAEPSGAHVMLVLTGGSAWEAGASTILGAPFGSFLFDLIDGPDNWHLVRAVPADRGVVCGALRPDSPADQSPELVWAANYAASSMGRGLERVGLSNASSFASLGPDAIARSTAGLARAARLAQLPIEDAIAEGLDPRTIRQPFDRPGRRRGARKPPATGR